MTDALKQAQSFAATGMNALRGGNGDLAQQAFLKAIDLGWPGPDVWVALSQARLLLGDTPGRRAALENALTLKPDDLRARFYLAEVTAMAGDTTKAVGLYRAALKDAGSAPSTTEMQQLITAANAYVSANSENTTNITDAFVDADLGAHPDDELFEQSLAIAAGAIRPYHSHPTRFLYPGLPNREFFPRQNFKWAAALEAHTQAITDELTALLDSGKGAFAPYVESTGREGSGVTLQMENDPAWSAFYLMKQGQQIQENMALCPRTCAAINEIGADGFPGPAPSVLFSLLRPGARIPPHHGMLNTRLICHLPLIIPEGCGFRVGNDTREWTPGEMFLFDDTIEHEAWNNSDQPRYILIFECWRPELAQRQRALLTRLFDMQKQ